jgi:hypothetical protein
MHYRDADIVMMGRLDNFLGVNCYTLTHLHTYTLTHTRPVGQPVLSRDLDPIKMTFNPLSRFMPLTIHVGTIKIGVNEVRFVYVCKYNPNIYIYIYIYI